MTNRQRFPLAVVLTAVSETLLCDFNDVHRFFDYMTGDQLMTHQLPRASDECQPSLKRQFPELAKVVVPEGLNTEEKVRAYMETLIPTYGTELPVEPLGPGEHGHINPIKELLDMTGPNKPILTFTIDEEK